MSVTVPKRTLSPATVATSILGRISLVPIDGDPLEDVGDLREIRYVVKDGRIVVRR